MYSEKVKIKIIISIMVLAVFWGINTSASVINQWMEKPIAPQLLVIGPKTGDFEIKLAGYEINHQEYILAAQNFMSKLKNIMFEANNHISPQTRQVFIKLNDYSRLIMKEVKVYWDELQTKFIFKDKWKSAILYIA